MTMKLLSVSTMKEFFFRRSRKGSRATPRCWSLCDEANVHLQKRGITLGDAQLHLDFLIENIKESNASSPSSNHWAKDCKLGSVYISKDSSRLVSKEFHNGVIKIQSGGAMLLTAREAAAVA
jgi:hypothetical protein